MIWVGASVRCLGRVESTHVWRWSPLRSFAYAAPTGKMFSEDDVMEWLVQICMALCYLHKKKWMHRDLKPHNVFLTGHKRIVKVLLIGFL